MKRIIEIEESDLERIREIVERENKTALSVTTRGTAYITIAQSKPYDEAGDCISREALKEQINATDFDFGDYYDHTEEIIKRVCEAIDNAPTVEPICPYLSDNEIKQPCLNSPCERPQGEIAEEQAIDVLHHHGWLVVRSEHKAVQDVNHKVYRNENCPQKHKCYDYQGYHCSGCSWEKKGGTE